MLTVMNRRKFVSAATAAGLAAAAPAGVANKALIELRRYQLRNGDQMARVSAYLKDGLLPAAKRAGLGPCGAFNAVIGEGSPFVLAMLSYPSLAGVEEGWTKIMADADHKKAYADMHSMEKEPSYARMENSLLRSFDSWPQVTTPSAGAAPHIFELRTYENKNEIAAARKDKMFDDGEAAIFKRLGFQPVFFGRTIVGRNMPNLVYMVTFDNLAAREKLWSSFGGDEEWKKLRATPGLSDPQVVSNISNAILRPLPFSPIK